MIGQALYVRGMNMSDSEDEDQCWDDTKLNEAYDKALQIANAEVAKRIAMSTNSKAAKEARKSKKEKSKQSTKSNTEWKAGMPCRAIYEEDGLEYEAFVSRIIDDKECVVKFLGYENSEIVPIDSLSPTHGNDERMRQIEQLLNDNADDGFGSQSLGERAGSDAATSAGDSERSKRNKKMGKKKKNNNSFSNAFPELPNLQMPNMSMLKNLGIPDMPLPPPPPLSLSAGRSDSEEQAVSTMLLSWYMSGYYTGLYQGMKRARENRR